MIWPAQKRLRPVGIESERLGCRIPQTLGVESGLEAVPGGDAPVRGEREARRDDRPVLWRAKAADRVRAWIGRRRRGARDDGTPEVVIQLGGAERTAVDAHLVDEATEVLAPDVVGAEGERAVRRAQIALVGKRSGQGAVDEQAQVVAVIGRGQVRPLAGIELARAERARDAAQVDARNVGLAVRVERVGAVAGGLLEDDRAPVRGGLGLDPCLERHPGRQVEGRAVRHGDEIVVPVEGQGPAEAARAGALGPFEQAVVAAALVDDAGADGLLEAVRGDGVRCAGGDGLARAHGGAGAAAAVERPSRRRRCGHLDRRCRAARDRASWRWRRRWRFRCGTTDSGT